MKEREEAAKGIKILKNAVLGYISKHDGCLTKELLENLALNSPNVDGGRGDTLLWGIANLLIADGRIEIRKANNRNRFFIK